MKRIPLVFAAIFVIAAAPIQSFGSPSLTVLATNIGYPGDMIVDGSSIYWVDNITGHIHSVSKNPGGSITTLGTMPSADDNFVQDDAFIYFADATKAGGLVGDYGITKVSKAENSSSSVGTQYAHGGLAMGPADGTLYYPSHRDVPQDINDVFLGIASISTLGGADQMLIYLDDLGAGYFDGTYYTGQAALVYNNYKYWIGGNPGAFSTDSTYLYWQDASYRDSIWQMPLVGGNASAIVSGRIGVRQIATPTTGAAAGSIFWIENNGSSSNFRLMRREVGGQIITVVTNITAYNRCFAVDDALVYCEQAGGLVQVSIDGGKPTVISSVLNIQGPDGVAVDASYIYCGTVFGRMVRIPRPGIPPPPPPSAPLTLQINGPGTVKPFYNGQSLEIGKVYSISAKGAKGCQFTGWTGATNSNSPKLTFVMATNLSLTASFADITRPVMAVMYPKAKAHITNEVITASGKSKDNISVAAVYYQLNAGSWLLANGTTNWSATNLTLVAGTNVVRAFAVDTSDNNSLTNTITFNH